MWWIVDYFLSNVSGYFIGKITRELNMYRSPIIFKTFINKEPILTYEVREERSIYCFSQLLR